MKLKLKTDITIFILFLIPISVIVLNSTLIVGDELWNFQNVIKLSRGMELYSDFNVIVTPMFFHIGKIFLQIFGQNIFSFRIYNIVIFNLLMFGLYKLFNSLRIDKVKSFIATCMIFIFIMPYINVGANYNVLAIFLYVLGMIVFLNSSSKKYSEIIQGIIIYLIIFTKQNIGVFYALSIVVIYIITYKKDVVIKLLQIIGISFFLSIINILIIAYQGNLYNFINYVFLGMSSFTKNNFILDKEADIIIIAEIAIGLLIYGFTILLIKLDKLKSSKKTLINLIIFSVFLNLSIFPIVNLYHTMFSIILNMVILLFVLGNIIQSYDISSITLKIICIFVFLSINMYGIMCGIPREENTRITDKENVFFSSNINKKTYDEIELITSYIENKKQEGKDVIVLSQNAALYMIPLGKNNGELDLAFVGNLGYKGEEKLLDKIDELEDTEILLNTDIYWQEVEEVRLHIINNYKNIGSINKYNIYVQGK